MKRLYYPLLSALGFNTGPYAVEYGCPPRYYKESEIDEEETKEDNTRNS